MSTATLLEKAYGNFSPQKLESILHSLCKGLKTQLRFANITKEGWIQIETNGEDQKIALRYLDQKIGLAPISKEKFERFSILRGIIIQEKQKLGLLVDIGVYSPKSVQIFIPLRSLQSQLVDGKKLALQQIKTLFCLQEHFPIKIKYLGFQDGQETGELSTEQVQFFAKWVTSRLERLIVFGCFLDEVEEAIRVSNCFRDVVKIEELGLLENAVVCKLGTDAVGLIPKLGKTLPNATFAPFSPAKILNLIEESSFESTC
jgi:hypothetical protein